MPVHNVGFLSSRLHLVAEERYKLTCEEKVWKLSVKSGSVLLLLLLLLSELLIGLAGFVRGSIALRRSRIVAGETDCLFGRSEEA